MGKPNTSPPNRSSSTHGDALKVRRTRKLGMDNALELPWRNKTALAAGARFPRQVLMNDIPMTPPALPTDSELEILRVLWGREPCAVRDVHETLRERGRSVA